MASTLFPPDFIWGAATSAFQIEGSPLADGAGPSNWQAFCHEPGRVINNDHGDLACDHYRRYPEDIRLMQEIGLGAYRFSINWARIFPEGRGPLNVAGLDFYKRLLDKLEVAGITPYVTLHHWDYPLALSERGGWQERDSAPWFADYSAAIFQALGTRISHWSTFNEPWVMVHEGYVAGSHPPGVTDMTKARVATHNILRAHGMAVQAFRAETQGEIGIVVNLEPKDPASDSALDLAATRRADAWMNRQFLDPLLLGHYPEELEELWGNTGQPIAEEDFRLIQTPIDFVGINYYSRSVVRNAPKTHLSGPTGSSHWPRERPTWAGRFFLKASPAASSGSRTVMAKSPSTLPKMGQPSMMDPMLKAVLPISAGRTTSEAISWLPTRLLRPEHL